MVLAAVADTEPVVSDLVLAVSPLRTRTSVVRAERFGACLLLEVLARVTISDAVAGHAVSRSTVL